MEEKYISQPDCNIDVINMRDNEPETRTDIIKGEFQDEYIFADGTRETKTWEHNLIVADFGRLLAALCKGHAGIGGITQWEVGSGNVSWDTTLPTPMIGDVALMTPVARVPVTIVFLDASNVETAAITNKIEMRAYFDESTANTSLREFAVFGGNATSTLGSGIMCDRVIHQVVNKNSNMALQRKLRFTF
jgi:hypothetical protein